MHVMAGSPFQLLLSRPELLLAHGHRYAGLVGAEFSLAARDARRRLTWLLAASAFAVATLTLVGVAALLHLSTPLGLPVAGWAVPGVTLGGTVICALLAQHRHPQRPFAALRQELAADAQWLGMASMLSGAASGAGEASAAPPAPVHAPSPPAGPADGPAATGTRGSR